MSRVISVLIILLVVAGVTAASIGKPFWGLAFCFLGICVLGIRRTFDLDAVIREGGVPDAGSGLADPHHSPTADDSHTDESS